MAKDKNTAKTPKQKVSNRERNRARNIRKNPGSDQGIPDYKAKKGKPSPVFRATHAGNDSPNQKKLFDAGKPLFLVVSDCVTLEITLSRGIAEQVYSLARKAELRKLSSLGFSVIGVKS